MVPFDDGGVFWLPHDPSHTVSGNLTFDGDSISLTIDGSLRHVEIATNGEMEYPVPAWVVEPVVLGRLRNTGEVTLLDVGGLAVESFLGHSGQETWTTSIALLGAAVPEPRFDRASFSFDVLVPWAKPPNLVDWDEDDPRKGTIDLSKRTLDEVVIGPAAVRLTSNWFGNAGGDVVDVRRRCWVAFDEMPPLSVSEILDEWVRPVQNLLIVLLGQPVRLIAFSVVHAQQAGQQSRDDKQLKVVLADVLVAPSREASWGSLRSWGSPTMFVREELPIGFGELLSGWMEVQERFGEAITLLCSPFYAPFMYSEHRYASTFQSAESMAQAKYAGRELPLDEHQERVRAIVDAAQAGGVSPEHVGWAERILTGRNDKPLKQLIDELLASLGTLGQMVLERDPNFARTAATARARVSHPGSTGGLSTEQRHWYGAALSWLVRAGLAVEAGLPLEGVTERIVRRGHFTQVVERLKPS